MMESIKSKPLVFEKIAPFFGYFTLLFSAICTIVYTIVNPKSQVVLGYFHILYLTILEDKFILSRFFSKVSNFQNFIKDSKNCLLLKIIYYSNISIFYIIISFLFNCYWWITTIGVLMIILTLSYFGLYVSIVKNEKVDVSKQNLVSEKI